MRRAVLFGNNYKAYPENELKGCHNDVRNIADELVRGNIFCSTDISVHMDGRDDDGTCTQAGMMRALTDMAAFSRSRKVDLVYVHYSGHGCKTKDADGRVHECILPSDFEAFEGDAGLITDDWLTSWALSFHPRTRLVVVFDCCYSGSDLEVHRDSGRKLTYLSGCKDNQTSEDAYGVDKKYKHTGAMTTCLVQTLQLRPWLFDDTIGLHRHLCELLKKDHFSQVPVLKSTHSLEDDPTFLPEMPRSGLLWCCCGMSKVHP